MRKNLPVTGQERLYSPNIRLISTTDLHGTITHVNDAFCEVAGYGRHELLGQPHNIIRHPDMPSAAFAAMWTALQAGRPWIGMVKNRCKNGDHYWVSAYVSPIYENGRCIGYESVRTCPARSQVIYAERLYQHINRGRRFRLDTLLDQRNKTAASLASALLLGLALGSAQLSGGLTLLLTLGGVGLAGVGAHLLTQRLRKRAAATKPIFDDAIGRLVYGRGQDEVAQFELALAMTEARAQTVLGRIGDISDHLQKAAESMEAGAAQTGNAIIIQRGELEQAAAAMNQMTATVQEIAAKTAEAANLATEGKHRSQAGKSVVLRTAQAMESLANEVEQAADAINHLSEESERIRSVLDVIGSIAEQTNLLALNAAIEAARAGDKGRGFAVVADEVRTLANRTGTSTNEIAEMIERLERGAQAAVSAMELGRKTTLTVRELASEAGTSIETTERMMQDINDMSAHIATATQQQSTAAEEIDKNITEISDHIRQTADSARQTTRTGENLLEIVTRLRGFLLQYGGQNSADKRHR
ncbi:hypothetical protein CAI21_00305 [Alkalilimnicola ehrlichii]|uniref:Chemotaxis protein n=1 Tax=Alkalilimnicola ehrlichii TaxID=351052 RepID=A0A3E0X4B3_9GAMM|nr:PAS domain-containing methyl-accepting chemotaxis protein [Alkalilimnicola ehrlichii]RFA31141.1 hypothetical protein CAI21_00305 [Alkalilimnicola ehrlichii]RFA39574.1 hypothetical protein CAL65_02100 [Alkalilimnicola ehrlichii]